MQPSHSSDASDDGVTLRLLWPQWQGAGTASVQELGPRIPLPGGPPGLCRRLGRAGRRPARQHDPARIITLGGECAISVAPFSALARRYGDDLAIVWIDSHPDVGTPASTRGSRPWRRRR
jgi:arginase